MPQSIARVPSEEGQVVEVVVVVHNSAPYDVRVKVNGKLSLGGVERPVRFIWDGPFLDAKESGTFIVPIIVPCEIVRAIVAADIDEVRYAIVGVVNLMANYPNQELLHFERDGQLEVAAFASCRSPGDAFPSACRGGRNTVASSATDGGMGREISAR